MLVFSLPTVEEWEAMSALFYDSDKVMDDDRKMVELQCQAINMVLVGWKHITDKNDEPIKFDPSKLKSIIRHMDLMEIRGNLLEKLTTAECDLKNSVWQSQLALKKSAATAETERTTPKVESAKNSNA